MIKSENINEIISSNSIDYFSFITFNNDIYNKIPDEIKNISSFYYISHTIKKYYIEEFTDYHYKNEYNYNDITIESGEKTGKYKFTRLCSLNVISENIINIISDAAMYVFIDNKNNIFKDLYKYLDNKNIPYIKIEYNKKYKINNIYFESAKKLFEYIIKNYYL